ncbi:hypothetical protein [Methylobacterium sp. D54C]
MPRLIVSFDMNTAGPESAQARQTFESKLVGYGWTNQILVNGTRQTLPDTTLVSDREDEQAKTDVAASEAAAKKIEPKFALTKYVISAYRRVDSRSDD